MLDFNNEQEQKTRNYGPIPTGSAVLVKISLVKPQYPDRNNEYVSRSKTGLLSLYVQYDVVCGTYQGCSWRENLWLPQPLQTIMLTDGQKTACNMAGAKLRAMTEAHRNILPKDDTPKATRARQIQDWLDLNGFEFPVIVGIDKKAYEKNGNTYWNNTTIRVITPDKEEYANIMEGGEIITNGAINGNGSARNQETEDPDAWRSDSGPAFPSEASGMDEVPF